MTLLQKVLGKRGPGSPLKQALDRSALGHSPHDELEALEDPVVSTLEEAEALCRLVSRYPLPEHRPPESPVGSNLHSIAALFQTVESKEVARRLFADGVPHLGRLFRMRESLPEQDQEALLFVLKVIGLYPHREGTELIASAIAERVDPEGYLWSVILETFEAEHPESKTLYDLVAPDPPAEGFLEIVFLDFTNRLAAAGVVPGHAFDDERGAARLAAWLASADPDHFSYARSAAAAIPFLAPERRAALFAKGAGHPSADVRIETAWAAARSGDEEGLATLVAFCEDPRHLLVAEAYLTELGAGDRVPAASNDEAFRAAAEMSSWLAHPSELGRIPDEIEVVLSRELYWPPTDDRRTLSVVRYRYAENEDGHDSGFGLVGSVTFALFGETTADLSPDEVLALHCCWELEINRDPRAPARRSVEDGVRILNRYNPTAPRRLS